MQAAMDPEKEIPRLMVDIHHFKKIPGPILIKYIYKNANVI
jgi:hypothetical protein